MNQTDKSPDFQLTIRLFAQAAQLAAASSVNLQVSTDQSSSNGIAIQHIAVALSRQYPSMAELIQRSRWAVDGEFVSEQAAVLCGQEIALIPPVSGG